MVVLLESDRLQPTPTDPETGLVIDQPDPSCFGGEECIANLNDPARGCYTDFDHYMWQKDRFNKDGPDSYLWRLRNAKIAGQPDFARCRHTNKHRTQQQPAIPREVVGWEYIHQADDFELLAVQGIRLAKLESERAELLAQAYPNEERLDTLDTILPMGYERAARLGETVVKADLIPVKTKANPYSYMLRGEREEYRTRGLAIVRGVLRLDVWPQPDRLTLP